MDPDLQNVERAPSAAIWFVYLIECADRTLYCGVTTNLERRLRQHNGELVGGARYTRARRPVRLVWSEMQPDRVCATRREVQVKRLSRTAKLRLLSQASSGHEKG